MGQYKRKLKKGWRWYFSGQYLGEKYHSKAIYHSKTECVKAERAELQKIDEQSRSPINDIYSTFGINKKDCERSITH